MSGFELLQLLLVVLFLGLAITWARAPMPRYEHRRPWLVAGYVVVALVTLLSLALG